MKKDKSINLKWMGILLLSFIPLLSCNKDEPVSGNAYVNNWIYENMRFWYYWNTSIPTSVKKSQEPDIFFESLLKKPDDRFSWIQDNFSELLNSLQGVSKEAGYEFQLYYKEQGSNVIIAQILYVKKNSPAENIGLKRGDIISHINGTEITEINYKSLIAKLSENHSITYRPLILPDVVLGTATTISLSPVVYAENPNFLHTIYAQGNKKIGYYVYNFFASGVDNGTEYDDEMAQIFTEFKNANITDLILDLRYNSGGSEISTVNLASLIGKGVDNTKVFTRREYNQQVNQAIIKDPQLGENFLTKKFELKAQNIGSFLTGGTVYVLTSSRSASASELLINGLRPYMNVFIIGDKTYGKNVGSISLYEENDPKNKWGMQPIVVKSLNSLNQSDYSDGFVPNIEVKEDNALYALGDLQEKLLSRAIQQITSSGRIGELKDFKIFGEKSKNSLDFKRRSYNLIIENDLKKVSIDF